MGVAGATNWVGLTKTKLFDDAFLSMVNNA